MPSSKQIVAPLEERLLYEKGKKGKREGTKMNLGYDDRAGLRPEVPAASVKWGLTRDPCRLRVPNKREYARISSSFISVKGFDKSRMCSPSQGRLSHKKTSGDQHMRDHQVRSQVFSRVVHDV